MNTIPDLVSLYDNRPAVRTLLEVTVSQLLADLRCRVCWLAESVSGVAGVRLFGMANCWAGLIPDRKRGKG